MRDNEMTANTYDAMCDRCKEPVPAREGEVSGKLADGSWRVVHTSCIPEHIPMRDVVGPALDYWQKTIIRRQQILVKEIECLQPEELDILRETPQAALLREWLGKATKLDYDL
jgi:hypothetical protein